MLAYVYTPRNLLRRLNLLRIKIVGLGTGRCFGFFVDSSMGSCFRIEALGCERGLLSNRIHIPLNENNWLEYFLENPLSLRPTQEELMKGLLSI